MFYINLDKRLSVMAPKILIVYASLTGNTGRIARLIAQGVEKAGGEVRV